jgi:recombination protein RecA
MAISGGSIWLLFWLVAAVLLQQDEAYLPRIQSGSVRNSLPVLSAKSKKDAVAVADTEEGGTDRGDRVEALSGVLHQIERVYGKGSIQKLGDTPGMNVATTASGSLTLDMALGGGYPRGRVVEIYGPESSGKTTLALHAVAEIQRAGGMAAFIDAEHALDPVYARNLGVNVDDLLVCQPDSGEMALDVVDQLVRSSAVDVVVVDSVAALVPRAELEGDMTETQMGLQARLMSKALRKITGSLSKSQTTVIFINQLRSKIGVMYGNPEVTAGGNALKFYSSVRIDVRRREVLKDNQGIMVRVKVVKNKVAPPFRVVEFDILFGSGIDRMGCLLDAAEACGIVERKGSWYSRGDLRFAQGRRPAIEFLRSNQPLADEITVEVRDIMAKKMAGGAALLIGEYDDTTDEENGSGDA